MKKKVLIVDDDQAIRIILGSICKKKYLVEKVSSGDEAIKYLKSNSADLIIIDYMMPGKNGLESTKEIKEINTDQKVIMLSGYVDDDTGNKVIQAGAKEIIKKPFNTSKLMAKISNVIDETN